MGPGHTTSVAPHRPPCRFSRALALVRAHAPHTNAPSAARAARRRRTHRACCHASHVSHCTHLERTAYQPFTYI
eukprot:1077882-Prorocentrum_minimum.AAC.2